MSKSKQGVTPFNNMQHRDGDCGRRHTPSTHDEEESPTGFKRENTMDWEKRKPLDKDPRMIM